MPAQEIARVVNILEVWKVSMGLRYQGTYERRSRQRSILSILWYAYICRSRLVQMFGSIVSLEVGLSCELRSLTHNHRIGCVHLGPSHH